MRAGAGHWHFTRTTVDLDAAVQVDLFMAVDRFPDAGAATRALARDVGSRFPCLRGKRSLSETVRKMPQRGEWGAYVYRPGESGLVEWRLRRCAGGCGETKAAFKREVIDTLSGRFGLTVETVDAASGVDRAARGGERPRVPSMSRGRRRRGGRPRGQF